MHVVAFFGSEGLFGYTVGGKFLWKKDLGRLNVGAYDIPSYEWGTASAPIIHWQARTHAIPSVTPVQGASSAG